MPTRPLYEIAAEIRADWKKPYFGAVPYLDAMNALDQITDKIGWDGADEIVQRFLGNANSWRGENARRIKSELKQMVC